MVVGIRFTNPRPLHDVLHGSYACALDSELKKRTLPPEARTPAILLQRIGFTPGDKRRRLFADAAAADKRFAASSLVGWDKFGATPDDQMALIWDYLHRFRGDGGKPMEWSRDQISFIRNVMSAHAPGIYGDSWDLNAQRVMKEWGWKRTTQQVMSRWPRRHGKTHALAGFAAAYLLAVPHKETAIFTTGRRISIRMLDTIFAFVCTIDGALERVKTNTRGAIAVLETYAEKTDAINMTSKITPHTSNARISALSPASFISKHTTTTKFLSTITAVFPRGVQNLRPPHNGHFPAPRRYRPKLSDMATAGFDSRGECMGGTADAKCTHLT